MCTIVSAKLSNSIVLGKNYDPLPTAIHEIRVEFYSVENQRIAVVCDRKGCYGALNSSGIGIVGTFVNILEHQNNYFDGDTLLKLLSLNESVLLENLHKNEWNLYGNMLVATPKAIYAFELGGELVSCKQVNCYAMTNHFQELPIQIRTINKKLIQQWTTKRLHRANELICKTQSIEDIKRVLSNHDNEINNSICNHGEIKTGASFIIDITHKQIHFCRSNPCRGEFVIYEI